MLFHPPTSWMKLDKFKKRTYSYLTRCHHGLHWNEGFTRYCRDCVFHFIEQVFPNCRNETFYVMGVAKLHFLRQEFPLLHFEEMKTSFCKLPTLPTCYTCPYRNHGEHCAYLKCYKLYYIFMLLL